MTSFLRWGRLPLWSAYLTLMSGSLYAQAEDILPLNVHLYDHDYGDLERGSNPKSLPVCNYDVHKHLLGLVKDTLIFDPIKGKKTPQSTEATCFPGQIENWFDAAQATANTCGNIFLRNVGTAIKPTWKFQDNQFFPMDSISKQTHWLQSNGNMLNNDYAFCMEINASIAFHGGETMKFNGDDDLWVYLDNRLAVDQGGIHYAMETVTYLDSLPFLAGKQGKNLDLDIYYCSRVPATSVFGMETDVELNPLTVKSIQIVDTAGHALVGKDIVVGKTRLCARPIYQLPGEEACGNYKTPSGLSFLEADWDINGNPLSNGSADCLDLDPANFPDNTLLNLTAKAGGKASRISMTLVRVAHPQDGLLKGDGKAESVQVWTDSSSGIVKDGLEVRFDLAGNPASAYVYPDKNGPSSGQVSLNGLLNPAVPIPWGLTGLSGIEASVRQVLFGHLVTTNILLRDGVSPVLMLARFRWGSEVGYPAYLDLDVSEPLSSASRPAPELFLAKLKGGEVLNLAAEGAQCQALETGGYRILLTENLALKLAAGDSLSLASLAKDVAGNWALPHFIPLSVPGTSARSVGPLSLQENPARGAPFAPVLPGQALIPVSALKLPLLNRSEDGIMAQAHGPVLVIPSLVPLQSISLRFHDHLGGFVGEVTREFTSEEWDRIQTASFGDTTWLRLMWYPVSNQGEKLGTGAYVVEGEMRSRDGAFIPGAGGEILRVKGKTYRIKPKLFGYIRG